MAELSIMGLVANLGSLKKKHTFKCRKIGIIVKVKFKPSKLKFLINGMDGSIWGRAEAPKAATYQLVVGSKPSVSGSGPAVQNTLDENAEVDDSAI